MGRLGKLLSFFRTNRQGVNFTDSKVDPGGGPNVTVEHFSAPGDDAHPLPGDFVAMIEIPRVGGSVAVGYLDPENDQVAEGGEKRIYARDGGGESIAQVWLRNDGKVIISNDAGSVVVAPDGSITELNDAGKIQLLADGGSEMKTPNSRVQFLSSGQVAVSNNGGLFELSSAGTFKVNDALLITASGQIFGSNAKGIFQLRSDGAFEANGAVVTPDGTLTAAAVVAIASLMGGAVEMIGHVHTTRHPEDTGPAINGPAGTFPPGFEDWGFRVKVTVQSSQVISDLTNYPVYLDLSLLPAGFMTNVNSDGSDIRVTKADEESFEPREVVVIDTVGGTGEVHFRATALSSTVDTDFYIYYGDPLSTEPAASDPFGSDNVWVNYVRVYHMNDPDPGITVLNSVPAGSFDLTDVGTMTSIDSVAGKIEKCFIFDGVDDGLFDNNSPLGGVFPFTIECLVFNANDFSLSGHTAMAVASTALNIYFRLTADSNGKVRLMARNGFTAAASITSIGTHYDAWHHQAGVLRSAIDRELYVNGVSQGTSTSSRTIGAIDRVAVGYFGGSSPGNFHKDKIDEVRFSDLALTGDYLAAQWVNFDTPATFYTIGSEEIN